MPYPVLARGIRFAGAATAATLAAAIAIVAVLVLADPAAATVSSSSSGTSSGSTGGASFGPGSISYTKSDRRHLGARILREGMLGHDVRVLQGFLTFMGYRVSVSGYFGPFTRRSVIAFQRANHMTPSGVATFAVARLLRQMVVAKQTNQPATINSNGTATAPPFAPPVVLAVVAAANRIIHKPYVYGGGHGTWNDWGYDCSGAVSYALHGGGLLSSSEDSTGLESWGVPGRGRWITVYANAAHTWVVVAGRAFDTANFGGPNIPSGSGPRWRWNPTGNLGDGMSYVVRHPAGL